MFLKETEENIRRQFAVFTEKFERAGKEIEARIHAEPADIALLLKYLYANMPFSDVADYSYEMFREFAAHCAQLRKEQIPGFRMRFFWTMWYSTVSIPKELLPADLYFTHSYRKELQENRWKQRFWKQITGVPKKPLIRQRMTVPSLQRPCIETGSDAAVKSRYLR